MENVPKMSPGIEEPLSPQIQRNTRNTVEMPVALMRLSYCQLTMIFVPMKCK